MRHESISKTVEEFLFQRNVLNYIFSFTVKSLQILEGQHGKLLNPPMTLVHFIPVLAVRLANIGSNSSKLSSSSSSSSWWFVLIGPRGSRLILEVNERKDQVL